MALEDEQIRKLEEYAKRFGTNVDELIKAHKRVTGATEDFRDELEKSRDSIRYANRQFDDVEKKLKKSGNSYSAVINDLNRLEETIESVADTGQDAILKQQMQTRLDLLTRKAANEQYRKLAVDAGAELVKGLVNYNIARAKALIGAVQSDASGFQMAGDLAVASIDAQNKTVQGVATVAGSVGSALTMLPGPAKKVGIGLVALGGAVGFASEKMSDLAKFGIEVAVKELEKTAKAYNESAVAGALFADGLEGLRNTAHEANLTVAQFANVLKNNSGDLAAAGIGQVEAAKQVGRVGKAFKESGVQDQLIKLGYSFEEQAALTAETMASMRRTAGGRVSDAEVATQTAKYAENLRLIASLTGEDAKKKVQAVQEQNNILAFQQELAKKSPQQRAEIDKAMALMTEQERKNFRERVIFGDVINKEGAIFEANVSGAREKSLALVDSFNNNRLTVEAVAEANAQYGDQIRESILQQQALGQAAYAAGGALGDVAKAMMESVTQSTTQTKEALDANKANIEAAKTTQNELTNQYVAATKSAQDLKIAVEIELTGAIKNFAKIANSILDGVKSQMAALGLGGMTGGPGGVKANLDKQDEANRAQMTMGEKAMSYVAGAVESVPQGVGKALSAIGLNSIGDWMQSQGNKAQKERVENEAKYLKSEGRSQDAAKIEEKFDKTASGVDALGSAVARSIEAMGFFTGELTGLSFITDMTKKAQEQRLEYERNYVKEKDKEGAGKVKMAQGGIVSGPDTGFDNVELHGTEAVIPLAGGRAVPVSIEGGVELKNQTPGKLLEGMASHYDDLSSTVQSYFQLQGQLQSLEVLRDTGGKSVYVDTDPELIKAQDSMYKKLDEMKQVLLTGGYNKNFLENKDIADKSPKLDIRYYDVMDLIEETQSKGFSRFTELMSKYDMLSSEIKGSANIIDISSSFSKQFVDAVDLLKTKAMETAGSKFDEWNKARSITPEMDKTQLSKLMEDGPVAVFSKVFDSAAIGMKSVFTDIDKSEKEKLDNTAKLLDDIFKTAGVKLSDIVNEKPAIEIGKDIGEKLFDAVPIAKMFDTAAIGLKSIFTTVDETEQAKLDNTTRGIQDTFGNIKEKIFQGLTMPTENFVAPLRDLTASFDKKTEQPVFDAEEIKKALTDSIRLAMSTAKTNTETTETVPKIDPTVSKLEELISVMQEQKELSRKQVEQSQEMASLLDEHKSLSQQLLNNTY